MKVQQQSERGLRMVRGFTLIEIIVVILILGVLATLIVPRLMGRIGQSKTAAASSNAATLAGQVRQYMLDCGPVQPGSPITILWECPAGVDKTAWKGPYVENQDALKDPWGKLFILQVPAKKNVDFDVVSYGADGQPGGTDENADVTKP